MYQSVCLYQRAACACARSLTEKVSDSASNNRYVKVLDTAVNKGMIYKALTHTHT